MVRGDAQVANRTARAGLAPAPEPGRGREIKAEGLMAFQAEEQAMTDQQRPGIIPAGTVVARDIPIGTAVTAADFGAARAEPSRAAREPPGVNQRPARQSGERKRGGTAGGTH